jgi:hypothetical protein
MMFYNTQNYWVLGLRPSSSRENVSKTGSVTVLREGGKTPNLLGPLERARGPTKSLSPHLRTETYPVSETSCFWFLEYRTLDKVRDPTNCEPISSLLMCDTCSTFLALLCNLNNWYVLWTLRVIILLTKAHHWNLSSVFSRVNLFTPVLDPTLLSTRIASTHKWLRFLRYSQLPHSHYVPWSKPSDNTG